MNRWSAEIGTETHETSQKVGELRSAEPVRRFWEGAGAKERSRSVWGVGRKEQEDVDSMRMRGTGWL